MKGYYLIGILAIFILLAGCYKNPMFVKKDLATSIDTAGTELGDILIDENGNTLYVRQGDVGASTCYGICTENWPPLIVKSNLRQRALLPLPLGNITRTDGIVQATYGEMPLYYYSGDLKPGDMKGNGMNGIWSVVIITPERSTTNPVPYGGSAYP